MNEKHHRVRIKGSAVGIVALEWVSAWSQPHRKPVECNSIRRSFLLVLSLIKLGCSLNVTSEWNFKYNTNYTSDFINKCRAALINECILCLRSQMSWAALDSLVGPKLNAATATVTLLLPVLKTTYVSESSAKDMWQPPGLVVSVVRSAFCFLLFRS